MSFENTVGKDMYLQYMSFENTVGKEKLLVVKTLWEKTCICSTCLLKTLWEKEKLLVTGNFSFSYSVFKRHVLQTRKNQGLFGKGLKMGLWLRAEKRTPIQRLHSLFVDNVEVLKESCSVEELALVELADKVNFA